MRVAIFLCCCLSALLLAACAGPAADTGQVDNGSNPPVDALPGLPFEHAASVAVSTQIDGADYLLKSGSAAVDGTELELFSTLQDPSWGIWQLTPGNAELVNVQALLSIPAGSEAWVAVANYTSGRWEISGPTESSLTLPLNDAAHLSPSGNAHVAVIAAGADSLNVVRLVLATDRVGWQYTIYDDSALAGIEPQPLEVGGRPAIAYLKSLALDLTQIWFAYSSSVEGIDPGDWSHVLVYQADLATSLDAAIVNGNPAIVCQGRDPDRLLYIRSDTADGQLAADWPAPVEVASGAGVGWNAALSVNNGRPSIAYNNNDGGGIFYAHSNDPSGDAPEDWYVVRVIQADNGAFLDIADIAGNPAVAYSDTGDSLSYRRSAGADGDGFDDWSASVGLEPGGYKSGNPVLLTADGNPAVFYSSGGPDSLLFRRSSTPLGASGADWTSVAALESAELQLAPAAALVGGNPAVCYITLPDYDVVYRRSSSAAGVDGSWTLEDVAPGLPASFRGGISMSTVAGRPVVCWYETFGDRAYYSTFID